ncbi:MAG TPA: hypothetical protein VIV11_24740 [Kofleriaceae bacterium]
MRKQFFDDDDDDDDDFTVFEPNPWGARQRIVPRKGFKAAVSRIITLVPSLVRQLPPPIPAKRVHAPPPALTRVPAFTPAQAPACVRALPQPVFAAPALPTHVAALSALALAPRISSPGAHTWRFKRVSPRKLLSALAGGVVAVIIALIVQAVHETPPARAHVGASLAEQLRETHRMPTLAPSEAAIAMTVTPIETAAVPTVPEGSLAPAKKPIAKKSTRVKKPRRIVASDTSTPLGRLRPTKM